MRLIDADKLMSDIEHYHLSDGKFQHWVEIQPIIEPERKKGKWILDPNGMDWNLPAWKCSLCSCRNNNIGVVAKGEGLGQNPLMWAGSRYCPNCGSYNGGEEE